MNIFRALIIAAVLIMTPAHAFSSNLGYMHISLVEGDVQIKTPETEDWGYASINTPMAEGDQVWVPLGGRVELQLNSGSYIRLDGNTALQILSIDKDSSQFYLSEGYAYIFFDAPRGNIIQVDTPDTSTRAFNRSIFRIDISDRYTDVSVYKGYVETENKTGTARINAGSMVSLGQNTYAEVVSMRPSDEWERWNKNRNERIYASEGGSSRYLPAELRAYSYDFDSSGRWMRVPEYGYVWTPTVVVGTVWSPYRHGRWIWRGADYVWVGYEPWGWAPYHYGRWSFIAGIGWVWVPPVAGAVYWGPGYVGWVRTVDYVAWVPLAPGEIYYGRGYFGRHSVNITNVNITQVNITNVYKNVYVNDGVTVVNRKTFNTGAQGMINVDRNDIREKIFIKKNISAGAPDIKPARASYFTSDKSIPQGKLPPRSVRDIRVKELKQSRPIVKEQTRSVLSPAAKPKTLQDNAVTAPRTLDKGRPAGQQIQPEEKRRPRAPEVGSAPKGERELLQLKEKKKRPVIEVDPLPRDERKLLMPQERVKPPDQSVNSSGKGAKQRVQPEERRRPAAPKVGREQVVPAERAKTSASKDGSTGRAEIKQGKPEKKKPVVTESGSEKNDEQKPSGLYERPQKDIKKTGQDQFQR